MVLKVETCFLHSSTTKFIKCLKEWTERGARERENAEAYVSASSQRLAYSFPNNPLLTLCYLSFRIHKPFIILFSMWNLRPFSQNPINQILVQRTHIAYRTSLYLSRKLSCNLEKCQMYNSTPRPTLHTNHTVLFCL